jgi:probable HAF family extracellular repeat protein
MTLAATFVALLFGTNVLAAPIYTFVTFDAPDSRHTLPFGINDSGQIVGYSIDAAGRSRGFLKDGDSYTFPVVDGLTTWVMGINDAGQATGFAFPPEGDVVGFVTAGDAITVFEGPDAFVTYANGINDAGQIVGSFFNGGSHGFLKDGDTFTPIEFPGAVGTTPRDINDSGTVVGSFIDGTGRQRGFMRRAGEYVALEFDSELAGINDAGLMVAGRFVTDGTRKATINMPRWTANGTDINDLGQVVGIFWDQDEARMRGFVATPTAAWDWDPPIPPPPPVPEPALPLMVGVGLATWGTRAWKARRTLRSCPGGNRSPPRRDPQRVAPRELLRQPGRRPKLEREHASRTEQALARPDRRNRADWENAPFIDSRSRVHRHSGRPATCCLLQWR